MPCLGLGLALPSLARPTLQLGPELAVNGGFDDASAWTLPAGMTITGGLLVVTLGSTRNVTQSGTSLVAGRRYLVSYQVLPGGVGSSLGRLMGASAIIGDVHVGAANFSDIIVCPASPATMGLRVLNDFAGSVDNFSVREVL